LSRQGGTAVAYMDARHARTNAIRAGARVRPRPTPTMSRKASRDGIGKGVTIGLGDQTGAGGPRAGSIQTDRKDSPGTATQQPRWQQARREPPPARGRAGARRPASPRKQPVDLNTLAAGGASRVPPDEPKETKRGSGSTATVAGAGGRRAPGGGGGGGGGGDPSERAVPAGGRPLLSSKGGGARARGRARRLGGRAVCGGRRARHAAGRGGRVVADRDTFLFSERSRHARVRCPYVRVSGYFGGHCVARPSCNRVVCSMKSFVSSCVPLFFKVIIWTYTTVDDQCK
jgi:hypothetical protein